MYTSLLPNLVPLPNLQPGETGGSQSAGNQVTGEAGAFQLLLENMLFEVVAGQVLKDGKGLLAGVNLGLSEEDDEPRGQDLLALLSLLQGPLLEHFRQAQLPLMPVTGEPVSQDEGPQLSSLSLNLAAGMTAVAEQAGDRPGMESNLEGQPMDLVFAEDARLQGTVKQEVGPRLLSMIADNPGKEEPAPDNGKVFGPNGVIGFQGEDPLPEIQAGREQQFLNLMTQDQPRHLETVSQVSSFQQTPRAGTPVTFGELADQLIQSGKLKTLGERQEIEIQLKPEYLGKLAVRLSLENGVITARFLIENHQVARLVDSNLSQLKQTLEDQGVRFDQVQVEVGDPGSSSQERQQDWQRQERRFAPWAFRREETGEETVSLQEFSRQGRIDYRA